MTATARGFENTLKGRFARRTIRKQMGFPMPRQKRAWRRDATLDSVDTAVPAATLLNRTI
ncbi:hypothetical protein BTRA_5105 [Burkholderia thailandensis USAMRU Malaysia |nr:hypothetical protein BTQ_3343 [Burkholderia thailandensis 2002721723]AHI82698.1 hypothetical protein BTJ_4375 [Burkholderia thailandensis E444]AIC90360.1 hypothetical protein BTRA_5105 [Burkholderia thailandensis USAMRU Malaysia \